MKTFFTKEWNQPGTKLLTVFALIVAIVWSAAWSYQDGVLNLWPALYALVFYVFTWLMAFIFRNNP